MDQKIPLELEHIDGDNTNGLRENLTLLCPNCHALTPTYRGKNKKRYDKFSKAIKLHVLHNNESTMSQIINAFNL